MISLIASQVDLLTIHISFRKALAGTFTGGCLVWLAMSFRRYASTCETKTMSIQNVLVRHDVIEPLDHMIGTAPVNRNM